MWYSSNGLGGSGGGSGNASGRVANLTGVAGNTWHTEVFKVSNVAAPVASENYAVVFRAANTDNILTVDVRNKTKNGFEYYIYSDNASNDVDYIAILKT